MVEIQQLRTFLLKRSEFAQQPNLHNAAVTSAKSPKVGSQRKIKSARYFYISKLSYIFSEGFNWSLQWPGLDLRNIDQRR